MCSSAMSCLDAVLALSPGKIKLIFATRVSEVLWELKECAADGKRSLRVVAKSFDPLSNTKLLLNTVITGLADIALALWPDWYGDSLPLPEQELPALDLEQFLTQRAACLAQERAMSPAWLKCALALCRLGKAPLRAGILSFYPGYPAGVGPCSREFAPRTLCRRIGNRQTVDC